MDVSPIVYAIPIFFLMIGAELVASLMLKKRLYRVTDSVNDLSMGIIDQVGGAFIGSIMFGGYLLIWYNWRIFDMGGITEADAFSLAAPVWLWVTCFLAKDFAYYWAHRMSHEMNLGWATHIAHHQSEEYNLSVALRQGVFQGFFFNFFYFPLAFMGFPPGVYLTCAALNTIYQFWIHTRLVGKLGPFEWIMNTPSHHRVHHGRDVKYIDRNHAGVFIIWDRMFGSFQEEEEEPHYGLVSPLQSWNPLWGQVHYFVRLVKTAWAAPRPLDKLKLWFMAPAWMPKGVQGPAVSSQERWASGDLKRYETATPLALKLYVLVHFLPLNGLILGWLRGMESHASLKQLWYHPAENWPLFVDSALSAGLIFWTLVNLGAIFECRKWAAASEFMRVISMAAALQFVGPAFFGWPELARVEFYAANAALFGLSLIVLALRWRDFNNVQIIEPHTEGRMYGQPEAAEA